MEEQAYQSKKEARETRREEEREALRRKIFTRKVKKYAIAAIILAVLGYGAYFLFKNFAPDGEDFSVEIPLMDEKSHVAVGSLLPEYNSNPPTSGPHYSQTARSGFRSESIPDQNIIHNLEHGDVWISFHPGVSEQIKEELKQFAAAKVIITPRDANDTDIALASWGRLDKFNIENGDLPVKRIRNFIKLHSNQGPEKIPGASGGI